MVNEIMRMKAWERVSGRLRERKSVNDEREREEERKLAKVNECGSE